MIRAPLWLAEQGSHEPSGWAASFPHKWRDRKASSVFCAQSGLGVETRIDEDPGELSQMSRDMPGCPLNQPVSGIGALEVVDVTKIERLDRSRPPRSQVIAGLFDYCREVLRCVEIRRDVVVVHRFQNWDLTGRTDRISCDQADVEAEACDSASLVASNRQRL